MPLATGWFCWWSLRGEAHQCGQGCVPLQGTVTSTAAVRAPTGSVELGTWQGKCPQTAPASLDLGCSQQRHGVKCVPSGWALPLGDTHWGKEKKEES